MKKDAYFYAYVSMLVIGVVSLVLYLGMQRYLPFGAGVAFVAEGKGSTLVVTGGRHGVPLGSTSAFYTHLNGVAVLPVTGSTRRDGALHYYTSVDGIIHTTYPAQSFAGKVYLRLPLLGLLVRTLSHPIGMSILLGAPFLMVATDFFQMVMCRARRRTKGVSTRGAHA